MSKKIIIIWVAALVLSLLLTFCLFAKRSSNSTAQFPLIFQTNIKISGAVVPHHNIVARERSEFFTKLASEIKAPQTIILLSPNHYSAGRAKIQTTDQDWRLAAGQISADQTVISDLIADKLVTIEKASFSDEHGIYNILADIHNNFPEAKLVPLIFKPTSLAELTKLKDSLKKSCPDCLMIASVDFSHYQPALLADLHDDLSIRHLQDLNSEELLTQVEVDSGPSLALLSLWAQDQGTLNFNLQNHTNSGVLSNSPDIESTTHIFGWYQVGEQVEPEKSLSFTIGGDMMFARSIHERFNPKFNDAFAQFGERVFWGTDAAVINLEGSITTKPLADKAQVNSFDFEFSPKIVSTLSWLHINGASSANNHADNAGPEGVSTTKALLKAAKIQSFGAATDRGVSDIAYFQGQGLTLAVIGINLTFPGQEPEILLPIITKLQQDSSLRILIMPHWGTEYAAKHNQWQASAARAWIDAGADLVIGAHPHVVQDTELYQGVPIFYSLGNFLFDQAFSPEVQRGLLVSGKFTASGLSFFALPTQSIKYQPQLVRGVAKQKILTSLYQPFKDYLTQTPAGSIVRINKQDYNNSNHQF